MDSARPGSGLAARLTEICGADGVITDPQELRTYECDGLTAHRCSPGLVVLPQTAEQVAAIVRACAAASVPFVARGSGTGLSGGALPRSDGVLIVTAKMRSIIADRRGEPAGDRRAGGHQPRGQQGRRAVRPLLRTGSVQPGDLLGRRERGRELGWRALPQARLHRAPRDRPADRHPAGRADLAGRRHRRRTGLRPGRRLHGLRRHAGHRYQDRGRSSPRSPRR